MGKELGTYLRGMRRESKITVAALAKATGVSKTMVTYIEAGSRDPSFSVMIRYATAAGIKDLTPLFDVYLREQAKVVLPELECTNSEALILSWLDNTKEVLSVDISKILPLLESLDRVSNKLYKVCGRVKSKTNTIKEEKS